MNSLYFSRVLLSAATISFDVDSMLQRFFRSLGRNRGLKLEPTDLYCPTLLRLPVPVMYRRFPEWRSTAAVLSPAWKKHAVHLRSTNLSDYRGRTCTRKRLKLLSIRRPRQVTLCRYVLTAGVNVKEGIVRSCVPRRSIASRLDEMF